MYSKKTPFPWHCFGTICSNKGQLVKQKTSHHWEQKTNNLLQTLAIGNNYKVHCASLRHLDLSASDFIFAKPKLKKSKLRFPFRQKRLAAGESLFQEQRRFERTFVIFFFISFRAPFGCVEANGNLTLIFYCMYIDFDLCHKIFCTHDIGILMYFVILVCIYIYVYIIFMSKQHIASVPRCSLMKRRHDL